MCQAIKDLSINTRIFAVDRWEGNRDNGYFGDEFYSLVNNIKNKHFGQLSLELLREDFNTAVIKFEDKTIDLLHIDGLHTYEDVKNDFDTWLPKVSPDGIILFHDTTALNDDFGVYKLWDEIRSELNNYKSQVVIMKQSFILGKKESYSLLT